MSIRVCEHGQLARSCNICELESELAAARRETAEKVREMCAEVCRGRAEQRWIEHGITESDTNASYYPDRVDDEYTTRDEEDVDCAAAIRALDLSPFTGQEGK